MGQWSTWLEDLRDYVRSVQGGMGSTPARVIVTNGEWIILFSDPADTFLANGDCKTDSIRVFGSREDLERRCAELFELLEHSAVSKAVPPLRLGELAFHVSGSDVTHLFHGLYVQYIEQAKIFGGASPVIKVAPILYLQTRAGAWLLVEPPSVEYELPHEADRLSEHLAAVRNGANELLAEVNRRLGVELAATPLEQHYGDEESFEVTKGVVAIDKDKFIVLTGDNTHYLLPEATVPSCPFHDWSRANLDGVPGTSSPIVSRSTFPRSFFFSTELHHCSHREVAAAKASPLRVDQGRRRGLRSMTEGGPFCEIWPFEQHLCCRTCAFERVCTESEAFQLPCRRP